MTARDEWQDDRDGNQDDDDPFEDLHTPADHLIRDLLVDTFESFKLTQNTRVPFVEMESYNNTSDCPLPATVLIMPSTPTFRTRLKSAINRLPAVSSAMPPSWCCRTAAVPGHPLRGIRSSRNSDTLLLALRMVRSCCRRTRYRPPS